MDAFGRYVAEWVGEAPRRLLEIGAGDGDLAVWLRRQGFQVVAIDPSDQPAAGVLRATFEGFEAPGRSFDGVVLKRALHHFADVPAAMEKASALLRDDGVLVVQEFAWDRVDDVTGAWLYEESCRAGLSAEEDEASFVARWRREHAGLATFPEMRSALERWFVVRHFSWIPYLATEYLDGVPAAARREEALLSAGRILGAAFRCAARRRPSEA